MPLSSASLGGGYFKYAVGSHVIFYTRTDSGIDIVRVLHKRMDMGRHL
ncbi:type II toxin-antitoxin system RelE/ParE family toxin [Zavarzinia compransoris]|uniref:Type II toxin-antitoxin system RelE/ParE family toxin n=1 Tax=Zavarzinia compransoris TaxID=1264899 RepID=A0A317E2Z3_9PROT|nr:hypothetical protein DKG75_10940 [Zavarzinia compransoris]